MMQIYNAQYACGVVAPARPIYDASDGQYVQVFSTSNLKRYVCIAAIDKIDQWQEISTQYCKDTQFTNVLTQNAKICLHNLLSGKKIACKNKGESVLTPKSEVAGCIKVTCQDNYTKSGNQCVANCTSADNMEVSCPINGTNYLNAKSCVRECINGKLELYVKDCIDNSYTLSSDRKSCIKNPQVTTSTSTTTGSQSTNTTSRTSSGGNSSSTGSPQTSSTTTYSAANPHPQTGQPCTKYGSGYTQLPQHATAGTITNIGTCFVSACEKDYHVDTRNHGQCIRNTTPTTTTGGGGGNGTGGPYTISGQIKDHNNEVLVGVSIHNSDLALGTTTDTNGNFTLSNIPSGTEITFYFVGCTTPKKTITANENNLAITLDCTGLNIDTVEVTAKRLPQDTPPTTPAAPSGPADGDDCKDKMYMADTATYQNGVCTVHECYAGFEAKENQCVEISGPCKSLPDNATRGYREYDAETESEKCIVDDCVDGYVVADDKMSCREDYDAQAEAAREREQSTGNKLIGALGMGATGIGGSMLMSGLAESAADDDAERAMAAYLETFTCKYGNESVSGGTMNVEIPGGNELINMYSEYVALANDLKLRKAALGMKPGIESEPILDSATSGLYDDVGTGRGKGVYASLARALENPDGEDAKAWAAQREESEKKKKTGAITAGVGAGASLIGNIAINADKDNEDNDDDD